MNKVQTSDVALMVIPSTIPLKHRSNCPTARQLYEHLMSFQDFGPVKQSMIANGVCRSEGRASELVKAFAQWFAVGATSVTKSYVMLAGPIDRTFHEALLNTKWYFDFCYKHTGVYTHHDPLTLEQLSDFSGLKSMVQETLERQSAAFGDDLHPELKRWQHLFQAGKFQPESVSCVGNDGPFDIIFRGK